MTAWRVALIGVLLLLAPTARAADAFGDYVVTTWDDRDGLSPGRIRDIKQDADGYLWLSTDAGVVRFDGVHFQTWGTEGPRGVPLGLVTALMTARDGSIWLGVRGPSPVARIHDGALQLYGAKDGVAAGPRAFLEDHAGAVWVGSRLGLFRFVGQRWQTIRTRESLGGSSVLALYEDHRNRLWVGTSTAVYRRDAEDRPFEQVAAISVSSDLWQNFSEDAAGTVWVTDFEHGFKALGASTRDFDAAPRRGWGADLLHDSRGNFWVGTQGQGLWRMRARHGTASSTIDVITVDRGLASNAVQSLLEDREGNIWLGTLAGLQRLTPHKVTPVKNLSIPRAIEVTPDGSVFVGTAAGLTRFSKTGRREYTEANGLPGTIVLALRTDTRGDLWISTERGLSRFSREQFSPVLVRPTDSIQRVMGVTGADATLWLRDAASRLFRWSNGALAEAGDLQGPRGQTVSSIIADALGNLWMGAGTTLTVRSTSGQVRSYDPGIGRVVCLFEDANRVMWIGGEDGLARFAAGAFLTLTQRNGLPGGVRSIVEDAQGAIWVGTSAGVLRLERSELARVAANPAYQIRFRLYNSADGVAGVPFGEGNPSAVRAADGRLWFITSSGVTIVDPRTLGDAPPPPPVQVVAVTADARPVALTSGLRLPSRTSHLQMTFAAPLLSDPMRAGFRFRLDGFDRDWIDAGANRQATYTNLPPREYRFRVMASNGNGDWREAGVPWNFSIEPMFYQMRLFYAICVLAVSGILAAFWRLRVRQVRHEFTLVLNERIRMSRAIHDTLLQGVAAMALEIDDLSHRMAGSSPLLQGRLMGMRIRLEQYIREARHSILDLRSPRLEIGFLQALREAGERAIAERPVRFDLSTTGTPYPPAPSVQ